MILRSFDDTRQLARTLLELLDPGSLLLLQGDMGSGKTTLVSAIATELGSPANVSSPTYTLIHEYPTPQGTLVHIDAWRLPSAADLVQTGLDDYLDSARLVAVEWGEKLREQYPESVLVKLAVGPDGERSARIEGPE